MIQYADLALIASNGIISQMPFCTVGASLAGLNAT